MNCSFNIRYKPRTTRAFTKSDLTVYDSADNTALNALTVYGKSEVVDGSVVSAGEGYAVVDLASLTWVIIGAGGTKERFQTAYFYNNHKAVAPPNNNTIASMMCNNFTVSTASRVANTPDITGEIAMYSDGYVEARLSSVHTTSDFIAAINGTRLIYQLVDPTQGNAIAIKTDSGSGIDGTMATFATGTPLRGIPETTVRDVMVWDGSAGEVTKNCVQVRLADISNWRYSTDYNVFWNYPNYAVKANGNCLCNKYDAYKSLPQIDKTVKLGQTGYFQGCIVIKDTDYTTIEDFVAALGDAELVYELETPTTQTLTATENTSIAGLRTFAPNTHTQNNAQAEMTVDYTIRVPTI